MRREQLARYPYCQCPHHKGLKIRADDARFGGVAVVDHVTPHRGDAKLFWSGKLQSMTKLCHDKFKQSEERGGAGFAVGCDLEGRPIDPAHHWNR